MKPNLAWDYRKPRRAIVTIRKSCGRFAFALVSAVQPAPSHTISEYVRAITIRLVVGIWLILLTVIHLFEGYLGWALLTGAGGVANFGWPGSPIVEFRRNEERASR